MIKRIVFAVIAVSFLVACRNDKKEDVQIYWLVSADNEFQTAMLDSVCYLVAQDMGLGDNTQRNKSHYYGEINLKTKDPDAGKIIGTEYVDEVNRRVLAIEGMEVSEDKYSCILEIECFQVIMNNDVSWLDLICATDHHEWMSLVKREYKYLYSEE